MQIDFEDISNLMNWLHCHYTLYISLITPIKAVECTKELCYVVKEHKHTANSFHVEKMIFFPREGLLNW